MISVKAASGKGRAEMGGGEGPMGKEKAAFVSVIIPTYNRAWILETAVSSVLAQRFSPFELIVVDDGSTDGTAAMLAGLHDKITVIRQANRGVSSARNTGIRAARGSLIAFLDSDDHWLPQKLALQTAFFNTHPEISICQTAEIWIRNGVRVNPKKKHAKPSGDIFKRSLERCLVSPSAVMLRRRLFDEIGLFDETMPACEDYDMWLRIAARYAVNLIDIPLVIKTGGHADQLSRQAGLDKYRIQSLVKLIRQNRLSAEQRKAAVQVLQQKIAIYKTGCLKRGRAAEAAYYGQLADRYQIQT